MSKSLIIVESPAKARTIEKFLGRKFMVRASMGHVRDLPKSQLGVDVDKGFEPKYITIRGKGDILKELREAARKASKVYLATDPDREGEAISWHLAKVLGIEGEQKCRIEFHEITKDAVQRALKEPRGISTHLVEAQQARRVLDRLVGYKLSPLLWRKIRRGLSAGRVQSVAVRLITDREAEIRAFVPEEYWSITSRLSKETGETLEARYHGKAAEKTELKNEAQVHDILRSVEDQKFLVTSVKRRERRRNPAFPFTTSSLQQEASRKLGFSVRKTMAVAQQLYEGLDLGDEGTVGLVTYIRTDSTRISDVAREEVFAYIRQTFGEEYVSPEKREAEKKQGVQGAHEAIRPTSVLREPEKLKAVLSADQSKLYRLIWERFVSSQMSPAIFDTVSADVTVAGHVFRASGSVVKFRGFTAVYVEGQDDESKEKDDEGILPELAEGEELRLVEIMPRQHFTQPPARYTEAMLVRALEERGIGRPSTYAPIIETIQARGYVVKEEKKFVPTELGELVVEILREYFPKVVDVEFTADLEDDLDAIESGDESWQEVLNQFYGPFAETLEDAEEKIGGFELPDEESDVLCEKCGRRMVIKYGRFGKFLACPSFPECRFTKPILEETGALCPECGGAVVERKTKKGRRFYGCSNYPECSFVTWYKPAGRDCPECGGFLINRKDRERGVYLACVKEDCDFTEYIEAGENP